MSHAVPSNIFPSLTYEDAEAAIEWICRVFGFKAQLVVPGNPGSVVHSELSLGDGVVMVSSPKAEQRRVPPRSSGEGSHALAIYVEDPDAHFANAKAHGATITQELQDEEFGGRGYMANDPEGHSWYFGSYRPGTYWETT